MVELLLRNETFFKENWQVLSSFILELDESFEQFLKSPKKDVYLPWLQLYLIDKIQKSNEDSVHGKGLFIYRYLYIYVQEKLNKNPQHFYEDPVIVELLHSSIKGIVSDIIAVSEDKFDSFIEFFDRDSYTKDVHQMYKKKMETEKNMDTCQWIGMMEFYKKDGKNFLTEEMAIFLLKYAKKLSIPNSFIDMEFKIGILETIGNTKLKNEGIPYSMIVSKERVPENKRGDIVYKDKKIYLYAQNMKGFCKNDDVLDFLDGLSVSYHELAHYQKDLEILEEKNSLTNNIHSKEDVLRMMLYNQKDQFYIENYTSLFSEWEVEKIGHVSYLKYLEKHFPKQLEQKKINLRKQIEAISLKLQSKDRIFKGKKYPIDILFEQCCPNKKEYMQKYPDLGLEYKEDGTRKKTSDLLLEMEETKPSKKKQALHQLLYNRDLSLQEWFADVLDLMKIGFLFPQKDFNIGNLLENFYQKKLLEIQSTAYFNKELSQLDTQMLLYYDELIEGLTLFTVEHQLSDIQIKELSVTLFKINQIMHYNDLEKSFKNKKLTLANS
ncbi:MAG: hypothetical protein PHN72_01160 [Bacilli bacterium]|nr:hypothetical protein [Bacilli bacterium]